MENQNQVEFMGDQSYKSRVILGNPERPRIVNFLLKTGLVKTEAGSKKFLLGLIVVSILASVLILAHFVFGIGASKGVTIQLPASLQGVMIITSEAEQ